jgi:peptidoglycan/LPS O-acetylase OafA/YrhL
LELTPLHVALAIGILLTACVLIWEIWRWRQGAGGLSRKQRFIRIAASVIVIVLLTMVIVGDKWATTRGPLEAMAYWSFCMGLALILVVLALMDFRETTIRYTEERKRMFRDFIRPAEEDKKDG